MKSRITLFVVLLGSFAMALAGNLLAFGHVFAGSLERAFRVAKANDQALNAALGGSEDETLSSHANRARKERRRWGCILCGLLDAVQPNHCADSAGE